MKGIGKLLCAGILAGTLLLSGVAAADGLSQTVLSARYGWVDLASCAEKGNRYWDADGAGSVAAESYVTVISKSASVWAEPRTNSKRLASAKHGERIRCVTGSGGDGAQRTGGFFEVVYDGQRGYINEDYVVLNELTITLMESNVPAYIAPDRNAKKVGSLSKLTTYRVIGFYDDFYIINLRDAAAAFIPMNVKHYDSLFAYLYDSAPGKKARTSEETDLYVGPGYEYAVARQIKAGTSVSVYDRMDDWYLVRDDETGCFAYLQDWSLEQEITWP